MLSKQLLYTAYRLRTLHLARDGSEKTAIGTCFYVKDKDQIFLVTNRHNVDLSYGNAKYVGYKWEGMQVDGYYNNDDYCEISYAGQSIKFAAPKNPDEDVFVIEVPKTPMAFRRRRKPGEDANTKTEGVGPVTIDLGMLASDDDLKNLSAGTPVLLPSYSAHYDRSSERPVMRGGIVSSDPESNYQAEGQEPARRILFQAHSGEGASGGPVFAIMDDGGVLVGVNAGHLVGGEPKIGTIHSGFSYCFKATCVRECIEEIALQKP